MPQRQLPMTRNTTSLYNVLQEVIDDNTPKRDVMILMGDANAKVGKVETATKTRGSFGLGEENEAGKRLVEFCELNSLVIANTMFQQHPRRLYTWTSPNGKTRNQIDYFMIPQRWRSSVQVGQNLSWCWLWIGSSAPQSTHQNPTEAYHATTTADALWSQSTKN